MFQVYAVFGHSRFISILQTNVPAVLLDPDFNGMASLRNVDDHICMVCCTCKEC
jgi:hypothetical protein